MANKTILEIKDLDISFRTNAGTIHAIRGVNLDLQKGETVAIVGESGSGKSVTMKAACGLLDANATINSGEVLYTYNQGDGPEQTVDLLKLPKKKLRKDFNGNRIGVLHLGYLAETGATEEIFSNPIHPCTRSLLSAVPHPNPEVEKRRKSMAYDKNTSGIDYEQGAEHNVGGTHTVLATAQELSQWTREAAGQ